MGYRRQKFWEGFLEEVTHELSFHICIEIIKVKRLREEKESPGREEDTVRQRAGNNLCVEI